MSAAEMVWVVVFLNDEGKMEVGGAFSSFDPAMSMVLDTPRAGCVELELGKDYRDIKHFKLHTAEHPEGVDA